jgi:hypothetical protein
VAELCKQKRKGLGESSRVEGIQARAQACAQVRGVGVGGGGGNRKRRRCGGLGRAEGERKGGEGEVGTEGGGQQVVGQEGGLPEGEAEEEGGRPESPKRCRKGNDKAEKVVGHKTCLGEARAGGDGLARASVMIRR